MHDNWTLRRSDHSLPLFLILLLLLPAHSGGSQKAAEWGEESQSLFSSFFISVSIKKYGGGRETEGRNEQMLDTFGY